MPLSTVATAITAAATKKGIDRLIDSLCTLGKDRFGSRLASWRAASQIDKIHTKARSVRLVKTLWQLEKEIDLLKFYHPSKISTDGKRVAVSDLESFPVDGNVVVQGTVGQGKSIFFRYLASIELTNASTIPLFIELRKVSNDVSIVNCCVKEMCVLGFVSDGDLFKFLAENGKILLLLDGFDEVPIDRRSSLIDELEQLSRTFEQTRILISSRPESGIEKSALFRVVQLSPLEGDEYKDVLKRICHSEEIANKIISGLDALPQVRALLTTPLMVALLVFRYKADQSIPENAIAFYDQLFDLLLRRHDKAKAGFSRPRKSPLSDSALQNAFNAICYLTRKADRGQLTISMLTEATKRALARLGLTYATPDDVIGDIVEITCLIEREGTDVRFLHKSIQEYHSACFIKEQPDDAAVDFYEAMTSGLWRFWRQELRFLEQIDSYRYYKHFALPQTKAFLAVAAQRLGEQARDEDIVEDLLATTFLKVGTDHSTRHNISVDLDDAYKDLFASEILFSAMLSEIMIHKFPELATIVQKKQLGHSMSEPGILSVSIGELADAKALGLRRCRGSTLAAVRDVRGDLAKGERIVASVKAGREFFKFP